MIKTTAMLSAHTIHLLHIVVRDFFIVLIVLSAALFFWLIHGISIDKLDLGSYKIEGLYIKLDKKLTLKAKELTIPRQKESPSFKRVDRTFDQIKYLLTFFNTIMMEKINFKNNHLTLLYADDVLYITSDVYEIAGNIERKGQKLVADVSLLYIKKEDVTISGKLLYDLSSNRLEMEGMFEGYGITGNFRAQKQGSRVIYALKTQPFRDPAPLISRIGLSPAISVWITDRVKANSYKVSYLTGKLLLEGEKIRFDLPALKGKVHFDDVSIDYKTGVTPVHAKAMDLIYKEGDLHFLLDDPRHKRHLLKGSGVVITHVDGGGAPELILDLHVMGAVDKEVKKILEAYHLHIPVSHNGKRDNVHTVLHIPLGKSKKKISAEVTAHLKEGELKIGTLPLHIREGTIHYYDGKVTLENVRIDDRWYKGRVKGTIDIVQKRGKLLLDADRFSLGEKKTPFLLLKKRKIPMQFSYGKEIRMELPALGTQIIKKSNEWVFRLEELSYIVPYLRENIFGVTGGSLIVTAKDMRRFVFNGKIRKSHCFFYEKNNVCYTSIPVEGSFDTKKGRFVLNAFNKRLVADISKGKVKLHDLNIDLKVLLKEQKSLKKTGTAIKRKFVIIGQNSQLRYAPYRLLLDSYDIEVTPKGNIKAIGSLDGDIVKFTKKGKYFILKALRIKDKMLHPLINFNGLKHGRYSLKKEGNPDKEMKGRIIIEGGVLSDFKAYSNTLAFINTVPALATLHKPGFSNKGFKVEEGVVEYTMTPKKIKFDSVYLKGNSATVVGKGTMDLANKKLDINLAIMTVRELGKIVGKIPLLGYILMGDDNSMTVGLKITGTLNDPKVSTSVAKDILTLPLRILKRTITAPVHLGSSETNSESQKNTVPKSKNSHLTKEQPPASR